VIFPFLCICFLFINWESIQLSSYCFLFFLVTAKKPCASMRCHQLVCEFLANGPDCNVYRLMMKWYRGLCTDLLAVVLCLRKTPENLGYETFEKNCATSHRLKWVPFLEIRLVGSHNMSGRKGNFNYLLSMEPWAAAKKALG
jgi:hypothetical protein